MQSPNHVGTGQKFKIPKMSFGQNKSQITQRLLFTIMPYISMVVMDVCTSTIENKHFLMIVWNKFHNISHRFLIIYIKVVDEFQYTFQFAINVQYYIKYIDIISIIIIPWSL